MIIPQSESSNLKQQGIDTVENIDEPQRDYETRMLNIMIILISVSCSVLIIYTLLDPPGTTFPWSVIAILLSIIILQGIVFLLSRMGYRRFAIKLDIAFLCIMLAYGSQSSGGIYATSTLLFFIPLTLSATMLTLRFTILVSAFIIVSLAGLYIIEIRGFLPEVPAKDLPYRMVMMTGLIIILTLIFAYHRRTLNATEQQRIELKTTAERLKVQQQLTHDLAHDLKSPVSVLKTSLYLMKRKQEVGQDIFPTIDSFTATVNKLENMVEGFTELARLDATLESGAKTLEYIDLDNLIEGIFAQYRDYAQENDVMLKLDVIQNATILCTASQFNRVFSNLIENAIHYGHDGGIVTVSIDTIRTTAVITVADKGQGIAPENQEKIFDRFYRVNEARTSTGNTGSGIGLAIVKRIVEDYEGSINVESTPGEGSKFIVRIPLAPQ